jgi:hypothetical protein
MKRRLSLSIIAALAVTLSVACSTPPAQPGSPPSPAQQTLNTTTAACKNVDAAIIATDQAVLSHVLKGQDARNALQGLATAQAGCVAALGAIKSANAAAVSASGAQP